MNVQTAIAKLLDQNQDLAFGIKTTTGDFAVLSFEAQENINGLFDIQIELASHDPDIDLHALMDTQATLFVQSKYAEARYFTGIITEAERKDTGFRRTFYALTLRPPVFRLTHASDCRIWQAKTVPDIAKEVLEEAHIQNITWRLNENYQPREFCCQFNETKFDFLTRILNEEGIFWYFTHHSDSIEMIITDAPLATPVLPHSETIAYNANTGGQSRGFWVNRFALREKLRSTAYELSDYTFHNPRARMKEPQSRQEDNGSAGTYELFEYPGRYKDPDKVGKSFVKARIDATRVDATTGQGQTNHIHLAPGYHFTLEDHYDAKANIQHFLLAVSCKGEQPAALEEDAPDNAATTFTANFTTMPGRLMYRPPAPKKPVVDGPQIAMVTGPAGEEIYTDEHDRVKVYFYWDRHGEKNENSSCWVRVSQGWAGGTWGSMAIPRIGQEVIVSHLDGDIDQPIITGRTYHATNKPPYKLPENKTRMTIKSKTHKGKGYNELRFEDEAGKEEVFMHAQRDHNTVIENDESHHIKHDRRKNVDNNQWETIGVDKFIEVGKDHSESIASNKTLSVGGNHNEDISGSMTLTVGGSSVGIIGALAGITAAGIADATAGSEAVGNPLIPTMLTGVGALGAAADALGLQLPISGIQTNLIEKMQSDTVGIARTEQIGAYKNTSVGHTMTIHVGKEFIINAGKSKFVMDSEGNVTIIGTKFNFSASGNVQINGKVIDLN